MAMIKQHNEALLDELASVLNASSSFTNAVSAGQEANEKVKRAPIVFYFELLNTIGHKFSQLPVVGSKEGNNPDLIPIPKKDGSGVTNRFSSFYSELYDRTTDGQARNATLAYISKWSAKTPPETPASRHDKWKDQEIVISKMTKGDRDGLKNRTTVAKSFAKGKMMKALGMYAMQTAIEERCDNDLIAWRWRIKPNLEGVGPLGPLDPDTKRQDTLAVTLDMVTDDIQCIRIYNPGNPEEGRNYTAEQFVAIDLDAVLKGNADYKAGTMEAMAGLGLAKGADDPAAGAKGGYKVPTSFAEFGDALTALSSYIVTDLGLNAGTMINKWLNEPAKQEDRDARIQLVGIIANAFDAPSTATARRFNELEAMSEQTRLIPAEKAA